MDLHKNKWRTAKLGDVCAFEYGGSLREKERNGGEFPVYGSAGIVGWHDEALTQSATLIIGRKGSVGNVFYSEIPCFPIDTTYFVEETKSKENLHWLLYFLINYDLRRLNMATAVPGLNRNVAYQIEIPLPPLDEQERIVELFQSVEQSIVQVEGQEKNLKLLQKTLSNGLVNDPPSFGNLLSKKIYKPCLFGNIIECIEEHDRTPLESGLTCFIGLENIESENFSLQGFGNIENGTTFTKRFAKGDVLFGKRRAYLKKVAIADYDGICSSDILVFRAIKEKILPELLPYYVSSDSFINHAVTTSAGSLSPRTKWRDLAGFQLSIPDVKAQEKMADVFNQLSQSLQLLGKQKETLKKLKQKLLNQTLG
jgi:type I restriction enzyme S subunit